MKVPLAAGDVLLTSEAPTGEVAFLAETQDWALGQRLFGLRGKPDLLDGRYLFYALRGGSARHQLMSRATGTTVSGIRQSELVKVELDLPPIEEQRGIAATLGALDDKIDSNRAIAWSASELMLAEFRSAGDFRTVKASEALTPVLGGTPARDVPEYWDGDIPWASAKDVTGAVSGGLHSTAESITPLGVEKSAAKVLPAGTIVITARGTVGAMTRLGRPMAFNQTCYGLQPKEGFRDSVLYIALQLAVEHIRSVGHGTVFNTITKATFDQIDLQLPRDSDGRLGKTLDSLTDRVRAAESESLRLEELRNVLLPELLSGRIRVPEAREAVEART
jgi:type I restriction enzyme S subunit